MNSTFESNNGIYGGDIHLGAINGPAKVINSKFTNNTADAHMDAIAYGGAIFTIAPHLKVYNSEFNNNSAPYGGGAISVMFLRNTIEIENCTFKNNAAKIQGGAVEIQCSNSTIKNCEFVGNRVSSYYGGAVYSTAVNLTIENAVFKDNSAAYGGALFMSGANSNVETVVFDGNTGTYGGAVYLSGVNSNIVDSIFENNKASGWAGAILQQKMLQWTIQSSTTIRLCMVVQLQFILRDQWIFLIPNY